MEFRIDFARKKPGPARSQAGIRGGGTGGALRRSAAHSSLGFQRGTNTGSGRGWVFSAIIARGWAWIVTGQPAQAQEDFGKCSLQACSAWQQQGGGGLSIARAGEMEAREAATNAARSIWAMRGSVMRKAYPRLGGIQVVAGSGPERNNASFGTPPSVSSYCFLAIACQVSTTVSGFSEID